jgi:hypothetical protein
VHDFVGARHGLVEEPLLQGDSCAEDSDRPLVPLAGLPAVGAVRLAGPGEVVAGHLVAAAHQLDLCQRVEDGAGGFVELNGASHVQRAMERIGCPGQVAETNVDLAKRSQGDCETMTRAVRLVERHAALRQREPLVVAVLQHHHACLIAAHGGQHVVGFCDRSQAFGMTQRRHGFVVTAELRKRDAAERMDQREMSAVAGGVQPGRRLADMLPDDRNVANLAVALTELVVSKTNGPRVVRQLRLLERATVKGDGSRLIASGRRKTAVQPP